MNWHVTNAFLLIPGHISQFHGVARQKLQFAYETNREND